MSSSGEHAGAAKLKVVVADDDAFITSLVSDGLRAQGFAVATALTTDEAWELIAREAPHALVSDLNFGPGESAAALLNRVHDEFPWVGLVVLTAHQSPELAIGDADALPPGVIYLVKTQMKRVEDIGDSVMRAISGAPAREESPIAGTFRLTAAQAEVLRMLADGASTRSIAEHRGTSVRAAETMLARLYTALGMENDELSNQRVAAVRIWQQGRVTLHTSDRTDP